ncbi:MAG: hypothetical protein EAY75_10080 [Bacteroidetes bacterium]|nr:MAG: hypothetical protein EAY75_10080 [Bacteroidota bacterium]
MKRVMLSLTVAAFLALSTYAQSADSIIARYVTAIGGAEKWRQVKSLKIEGQIEVQGLVIPFVMQAMHGKGVRVDAEFQSNKIIDITTPEKGWAQNPMAGKTTLSPISADELKLKLDELDLQDEFVDYAQKGSTVEYLGKDEEDGVEFEKVKLTTKNGKETTYFFDTKTNLIYKEESTVKMEGQDVKAVAKNLSYQTVDFGIKYAFKVDQMGMMMVTNKVFVNATVDPAIFVVN